MQNSQRAVQSARACSVPCTEHRGPVMVQTGCSTADRSIMSFLESGGSVTRSSFDGMWEATNVPPLPL